MLGAGALRPKPPDHDLISVGSFLTARCGNLCSAFAALDDSKCGHLTGDSFARGMGRLGFREDTARIYKALDISNNGIVSMKQFLVALEPEAQGGREELKATDKSFLVTAEHALELATKAGQMCTQLESKISIIMTETLLLRDEVQAMRYEGSPQSGHQLGNSSVAPAAAEIIEIRNEIATIRRDVSSRSSATNHKVSELTDLMREISSEVAILRGRLQAIGERPDLAAEIVASGPLVDKAWQDRVEHRIPQSPRTPRSSDSDISALRPRSVSAERPQSTVRQFTVDAAQLLRSVERTAASPECERQPTNEVFASSVATSQFVEDSFSKPRHGIAPVLDAIAEARPSMERPSTQAPTSGRPSMETAEQELLRMAKHD